MLLSGCFASLTLANASAVGWLVAAAVPLIIHLLSRRRYRESPWAAMDFLLAALRRSARRARIEQLLLLLVRTSVIVLVVFAAAEPIAERVAWFQPTGSHTHRVIVIDGSFSMALAAGDESCFDRARACARRIAEAAAPGDGTSLVLMASPPKAVVGTAALEPGEILAEIDALRLPHATVDLASTLALVRQVFEASRRETAHLGDREVYFISDFQRVDWGEGLSASAALALRRQAEELAKVASIVLVDVGRSGAANLALSRLECPDRTPMVGRSVELSVTARNHSAESRASVPIELWVDGRRVARQTVDLPGAETVATFSHRFSSPGDHAVEARLAPDALDIDNHRYLALRVRRGLNVLCIDGRPSGEPYGGAAGYLALALAPRDADADDIHVDVAAESALVERDLAQYDCLFLASVAQFTAGEARLLESYLRGGGGVVFFLGDGVLADRYNEQLGGQGGGARILPALIDRLETEPQYRLDPLGFRHPIVQAFRGRGQSSLLLVPVLKYYRLRIPRQSGAAVALATLGGDPLVVEQSVGRGRVVLVATSADLSWTALPLWPSFVPLVHEILFFTVSRGDEHRNVLVGEPIGGSASDSASGAPLVVDTPDGPRDAEVDPQVRPGTWRFAETLFSGFYTARFGSPHERTARYAVNVDPSQSDLARVDEDELRRRIWAGVPFEWRDVRDEPARTVVPSAPANRTWHAALLSGVLGLLLAECFLAWRFGHPMATKA